MRVCFQRCPKTRWADSVKHDLHSAGLDTINAAQMVYDRPQWKAFFADCQRSNLSMALKSSKSSVRHNANYVPYAQMPACQVRNLHCGVHVVAENKHIIAFWVDSLTSIFNLQWFRPEKASAVLGVCVTCIVGACGSVSVYLQHCDL